MTEIKEFPLLRETERRIMVNALKVWSGEFGPVKITGGEGLWGKEIKELLEKLGCSESWNKGTDKCPHGVGPTGSVRTTSPHCYECEILSLQEEKATLASRLEEAETWGNDLNSRIESLAVDREAASRVISGKDRELNIKAESIRRLTLEAEENKRGSDALASALRSGGEKIDGLKASLELLSQAVGQRDKANVLLGARLRESQVSFKDRADREYCLYTDTMASQECLGLEKKIELGEFTGKNLQAFMEAAKHLGAHKVLRELISKLESSSGSRENLYREITNAKPSLDDCDIEADDPAGPMFLTKPTRFPAKYCPGCGMIVAYCSPGWRPLSFPIRVRPGPHCEDCSWRIPVEPDPCDTTEPEAKAGS